MLSLSSRGVPTRGFPAQTQRLILRLRDNVPPSTACTAADCIYVSDGEDIGIAPAWTFKRDVFDALPVGKCAVLLPEAMSYLSDGDIIALEPSKGALRVLYRRNSPSNSLLVTERCNHYCLMCSQPPKDIDDGYIFDELELAIPLISKETAEIGVTGGEPTIGGDRFLGLLRTLKKHLPQTAVHVLSNGRRFVDPHFAAAYTDIAHPDLVVGIPIYADVASLHDYIVQADGAFDETVRGILNLKAGGARVEVRIVIIKQNVERLVQLAYFLARNLTFVDHIALMGLEVTGFARANLDSIWIDPIDYWRELTEAALWLEASGMRVSIYNHQLCTIDQRVWHVARKSISDWKNAYIPECSRCAVRDRCGGFFATGTTRHSRRISAVHDAGTSHA